MYQYTVVPVRYGNLHLFDVLITLMFSRIFSSQRIETAVCLQLLTSS